MKRHRYVAAGYGAPPTHRQEQGMRHLRWVVVAALAAFVAVGCGNSPSNPSADSDSQQAYGSNSKVPTDLNIYDITGTVTADVSSLTRQVSPGHGSISGFAAGGSGFVGGSFFGPVEKGKGFVRLTVKSASPATDLAPPGGLVILKVTDTKATALLPGDTAHFRCRRQYEAVAAVQNNQKFNAIRDATWELDYCRLASPIITASPSASKP